MHYHYDNLDDAAIISLAQLHFDRFNQAWLIVMRNHYQSGVYIDASVNMDSAYSILGKLERYIYNSRPSTVYDTFKALNN